MLVSFIGSPCSGKTTTAAMLFAALKEQGNPCEFITEQARSYIAELRFSRKIAPPGEVKLNDDDQIAIMLRQLHLDTATRYSVGDGLVITDSSPLLSLLYMTQHCRERMRGHTMEAINQTDLVFFSPSIQISYHGLDPNRVHTLEQGLEIERSIFPVFKALCPEIFPKVVPLKGTPQTRHSQALGAIFDVMSR